MDEADLLVHVVDAADPDRDQQIGAVEAILADLGLGDKPRILVWNKADQLPDDERARIGRTDNGLPVVAISAQDGTTTTPLLEAIEAALYSAGIVTPHLGGDGGAESLPS